MASSDKYSSPSERQIDTPRHVGAQFDEEAEDEEGAGVTQSPGGALTEAMESGASLTINNVAQHHSTEQSGGWLGAAHLRKMFRNVFRSSSNDSQPIAVTAASVGRGNLSSSEDRSSMDIDWMIDEIMTGSYDTGEDPYSTAGRIRGSFSLLDTVFERDSSVEHTGSRRNNASDH